MTSDQKRWPWLSDNIHRRIASGEVPPPREGHEPEDPIRDLRLNIAIAEEDGDVATVERLNAKWLGLQSEGWATKTWRPQPSREPFERLRFVDDFHRAADRAQEQGDIERAAALRVMAMKAPFPIDDGLARRANAAEASGDHATAGRLKVEMLYQAAGEEMWKPEPVEPAPPLTREELIEARQEADAAGDWRRSDRLNAQLLAMSGPRSRSADFHGDHTREAIDRHAAFTRERTTNG